MTDIIGISKEDIHRANRVFARIGMISAKLEKLVVEVSDLEDRIRKLEDPDLERKSLISEQ